MGVRTGRGVEGRLLRLLVVAVLAIAAAVAVAGTYIASRNHEIARDQAARVQERTLTAVGSAVADEMADPATDPTALRARTDALVARLSDPSVRAVLEPVLADWRAHPTNPQRTTALREGLQHEELSLQRTSDEAQRRVSRAVHEVTLSVLISLVVLTLLLVVAGVRLRTWTTLPLRSLTRSVTALGEGDLTSPVEVAGPEDFTRLGLAVDELRRTCSPSASGPRRPRRRWPRAHPCWSRCAASCCPPTRPPTCRAPRSGWPPGRPRGSSPVTGAT